MFDSLLFINAKTAGLRPALRFLLTTAVARKRTIIQAVT